MYRKVIYAFTRNCCNQALALTQARSAVIRQFIANNTSDTGVGLPGPYSECRE